MRKLNTVGIETFVKYYFEFRNNIENIELFKIFLKNNEPWKESSCITKANTGKAIFKHNLDKEAISFILLANENKKR